MRWGSEADKAAVTERRGARTGGVYRSTGGHPFHLRSQGKLPEKGAFSLSLEGPRPRGTVCPDLKEDGTCIFKEPDQAWGAGRTLGWGLGGWKVLEAGQKKQVAGR